MRSYFKAVLIGLLTVLTQLPAQASNPQLVIQNRVLANVNGEPITTLDLSTRLDQVFKQQFPQYVDQEEARYQFFLMNWRPLLEDQINALLMREDAAEHNVRVAPGEVRQEMSRRFGGDILKRIDALGLTYDQAFDLVREDMLTQRITGVRVSSKAISAVTPCRVKEAYQKLVTELSDKRTWEYRVVSFRADDVEAAQTAAAHVYERLLQQSSELNELKQELAESKDWNPAVKVTVSELYERDNTSISPMHLDVIKQLSAHRFSEPVVQKGRSGYVARIFFLADVREEYIPSFNEMEEQLESDLFAEEFQIANEKYVSYLRGHYDVMDLSSGSDPFSLVQ